MRTAARTADGDVSVVGNLTQALVKKAAIVALLPALLVFLWLILLREPSLRNNARLMMATAMTEARADALAMYARGLTARTEALASTLTSIESARILDPAANGFPDARAVSIIPLDDLGTVKLAPGQFGLSSHIDVDIVRRAFAGERPPPEIITSAGSYYTLVSRPYGNPAAGVITIKLDNQRIEELIADSEAGLFRLQQRSSGQDTQAIIGDLQGRAIDASAPVAGTRWFVEFTATPRWISGLLPGWVELSLGGLIIFLGIGGAIASLWRSLPLTIRDEASHILDSAELKAPLVIRMPELLPLAKKIRQLSLLSRRQLVNRARKEGAGAEATKPETMAVLQGMPTADVEDVIDIDDTSSEDGIPDHIFRGTCIRGDAETELTDEWVERIGRGLAVLATDRGIKTLLVGHDARESSPRIRTTLVKALLAGGIDIIDLGQVAAPLVHFASHESSTHSGIMITGGSGPDTDNGIKGFFNHVSLTESDFQSVLGHLRTGTQVTGNGYATRQDPASDYIDRIAMDVSLALPLKLVVDFNFSVVSELADTLLSALDCEVLSYNSLDQGERSVNWNREGALAALGERVVSEGADLGVLFGADGGQLFTVTNTGRTVLTDQLVMILAGEILERNPGADVVYDVAFSRHFAPFITRAGGRAVICQGGDAYTYRKLLETNGALGGELEGHIFIGERWYGFSDGLYSCARLLEVLAAASATYNELVESLPQSWSTTEWQLPLEKADCERIMNALSANADFPGGRITTLDGLRVDYADGWGLIRQSNTQTALQLRFEGNDETSLHRVTGAMSRAIAEVDSDLELPF